LAHQITAGKQNRTFVVILSPIVQIPHELEKQFGLTKEVLSEVFQHDVAIAPAEDGQ
jgi:hypothetical protein